MMVFSMAFVLGIATWITQGIYLKSVMKVQGTNSACFNSWDFTSASNITSETFKDWVNWPSSANAGSGCSESLSTVQFWSVVR